MSLVPRTALAALIAITSAGWASPSNAAQAPDAWITTKVKMALVVAEDVSASAVRVDTIGGKVTLHGTVSSAGEKARAVRAAVIAMPAIGIALLLGAYVNRSGPLLAGTQA